ISGGGWEIADAGSAAGTWLHRQRVTRLRLGPPAPLRLGQLPDSVAVRVSLQGAPIGQRLPQSGPSPTQQPPTHQPPGRQPSGQQPPSKQPPGKPPLAQTMVHQRPAFGAPVGPGMAIRMASGVQRFGPGRPIRIGRAPDLECTADDPAVSRLHAILEPRPDGWWLLDRSTSGTFIDGEPVSQQLISEATEVMLGHPTAGYEIEVVPVVDSQQASAQLAQKKKDAAKRKRTKTLLSASAAIVALALVGGLIAFFATRSTDDGGSGGNLLTEAELNQAKSSSVLILMVDERGRTMGNGSGSIISADGQILTNAHVAAPNAPGLTSPMDPPARYLIALASEQDDKPYEPAYTAETIVADGVLDLAVMQIVADAKGNPIERSKLKLPAAMPLGDSDKLRTGDEITALGFPGLAYVATEATSEGRALTVTRGVVSTFLPERGVSESRAWIDSDIRVGSGNSGGASVNRDGEIIGVNTAGVTEATVGGSGAGGAFTGGSALIRPVNLARTLLEIAAKGGDPNYVSPHYTGAQEQAPPAAGARIESGGWSNDPNAQCKRSSGPTTIAGTAPVTLYAMYTVSGLPNGTEVEFQQLTLDGRRVSRTALTWKSGTDEVCAGIKVDIPVGLDGLNAVLVSGGSSIENPVILKK
ncbi:MAG: trypsin-like peptidase domain-containing protein, partial [Gordonia sp. (in: high G+C Gram-positive bacteria)]|uniref:trypsin-like peptidase domain-containing protein n=1 Tax=Gordonia sp. (in: high G+C Gram-positive bacteria) TaxID=84139 RepID=UPI003BB5F36F